MSDDGPCDLCGFSGLVSVERCDGRPIEARVGGSRRLVRSAVATCTCDHGAALRSRYPQDAPAPWPKLANLDPCYRPVGGWPDEEPPTAAACDRAAGFLRRVVADDRAGPSDAECDRRRREQLDRLRALRPEAPAPPIAVREPEYEKAPF